MQISYERSRSPQTYYDCDIGDVFLQCSTPFMVIPEIADGNGESYNAVNLEDGDLTYFEDNDCVEIVNAELIIK